jgi:hypothetical protein
MRPTPRTSLRGVDIPCPDCDGYVRSGVLTHRDSCPAARALEDISQRDRQWFTAHPFAKHYRRELMAGDLGIGTLEGVLLGTVDGRPPMVIVRQVSPGVRVRSLPSGLVVDPLSMWGALAAMSIAAAAPVPVRWWDR